jgi:hypothetical protein
MAERKLITAEYLHKIIHYDPKTGVWTWRARVRRAVPHNELVVSI